MILAKFGPNRTIGSKVIAIFATPFKDNLGFVKVRLFGELYASGFVIRRIHGTESMKTPSYNTKDIYDGGVGLEV